MHPTSSCCTPRRLASVPAPQRSFKAPLRARTRGQSLGHAHLQLPRPSHHLTPPHKKKKETQMGELRPRSCIACHRQAHVHASPPHPRTGPTRVHAHGSLHPGGRVHTAPGTRVCARADAHAKSTRPPLHAPLTAHAHAHFTRACTRPGDTARAHAHAAASPPPPPQSWGAGKVTIRRMGTPPPLGPNPMPSRPPPRPGRTPIAARTPHAAPRPRPAPPPSRQSNEG